MPQQGVHTMCKHCHPEDAIKRSIATAVMESHDSAVVSYDAHGKSDLPPPPGSLLSRGGLLPQGSVPQGVYPPRGLSELLPAAAMPQLAQVLQKPRHL